MGLKKMSSDPNDYEEVNQVLKSKWLRVHVRSRIDALNLKSLVSEDDIIQQVMLYLITALKSGKQIKYPVAWSKLVSERHIQKVYKQNKYTDTTEPETIEYFASQRQDETEFNDDKQVKKNIEKLKPAYKEILKMRYFLDLSWCEIAKILSRKENKKVHETTVRKRGERALNRLRQRYVNKLTD